MIHKIYFIILAITLFASCGTKRQSGIWCRSGNYLWPGDIKPIQILKDTVVFFELDSCEILKWNTSYFTYESKNKQKIDTVFLLENDTLLFSSIKFHKLRPISLLIDSSYFYPIANSDSLPKSINDNAFIVEQKEKVVFKHLDDLEKEISANDVFNIYISNLPSCRTKLPNSPLLLFVPNHLEIDSLNGLATTFAMCTNANFYVFTNELSVESQMAYKLDPQWLFSSNTTSKCLNNENQPPPPPSYLDAYTQGVKHLSEVLVLNTFNREEFSNYSSIKDTLLFSFSGGAKFLDLIQTIDFCKRNEKCFKIVPLN